MRTLEYLANPDLRAVFLPGIVAGAAAALMCGVLSPVIVVKRLGFVGQGISHSAFGGIGVASILAAWGLISPGGGAEFAIIVGFCVLAALGMGAVSDRRRTPEDTAIGLFLVASMALGAILVQVARDHAQAAGRAADLRSWDSILFGSLLVADAAAPVGVLAVVLLAALLLRRPLLFWTVDEDSARAFGVPTPAVRAALMILLALVVVTAMRVAGVILASALLILPGATALRLSDGLGRVVGISVGSAVAGLLAGVVVAFETDWQPGPCIVGVMVALFLLAAATERMRR